MRFLDKHFVENLPNLVFPRYTPEVQEILDKEIEPLSPEEALQKDWEQVGEDMRQAMAYFAFLQQ